VPQRIQCLSVLVRVFCVPIRIIHASDASTSIWTSLLFRWNRRDRDLLLWCFYGVSRDTPSLLVLWCMFVYIDIQVRSIDRHCFESTNMLTRHLFTHGAYKTTSPFTHENGTFRPHHIHTRGQLDHIVHHQIWGCPGRTLFHQGGMKACVHGYVVTIIMMHMFQHVTNTFHLRAPAYIDNPWSILCGDTATFHHAKLVLPHT
jgi:hypothetical protein